MLQCWLNMNIGVQSTAYERYGIRYEASSDRGKTNHSMQIRPIAVQRALNRHAGLNPMQWLGLQARHTLTVTSTLRNCVVLSRVFITIRLLYTFGMGHWRKSDIVCIWFVTNFRREFAGHRLSCWAETGFQILYLFKLSWRKLVHIMYFEIWGFRGPNIQVS